MALVFPGVKVFSCLHLPDESLEHPYRVRLGLFFSLITPGISQTVLLIPHTGSVWVRLLKKTTSPEWDKLRVNGQYPTESFTFRKDRSARVRLTSGKFHLFLGIVLVIVLVVVFGCCVVFCVSFVESGVFLGLLRVSVQFKDVSGQRECYNRSRGFRK